MSIQFARKEAERLVAQMGLSTPPIDVKRLAKKLGLVLVEGDLGPGVSGVLITNPKGARVCVNQGDHLHRKRFTIAHEIGHFHLKHQFQAGQHVHVERGNFISQRGPRASEGVDRREIEANQFAASLLMPTKVVEHEVQALVGEGPLLDSHVEKLAAQFRVSDQAMTIRLSTLGLL